VDYETCLASCVAELETDGPTSATDIALMRAYPVPTPAEWDDVLAATAEYDDVTNPFGPSVRTRCRSSVLSFPSLSFTSG
jgi:hypothetical protein